MLLSAFTTASSSSGVSTSTVTETVGASNGTTYKRLITGSEAGDFFLGVFCSFLIAMAAVRAARND